MTKEHIKIRNAVNGYLLENTFETDDSEIGKEDYRTESEVFESTDEDSFESNRDEALVRLLWRVAGLLGYCNSKHNEYRLEIRMVEQAEEEEILK